MLGVGCDSSRIGLKRDYYRETNLNNCTTKILTLSEDDRERDAGCEASAEKGRDVPKPLTVKRCGNSGEPPPSGILFF